VVQQEHISRAEHNKITRKNLISSLATGLAIGLVGGIPIGWVVHQVYAQQRLAQILLCHEKNSTGLAIGLVGGIPIGWVVHQVYAQQRLAQILLCHEKNRNKPEAIVESICGTRY